MATVDLETLRRDGTTVSAKKRAAREGCPWLIETVESYLIVMVSGTLLVIAPLVPVTWTL